MNDNGLNGGENVYIKIGRFLGRSPVARLLIPLAVAATFGYVAYLAWHAPDFAVLLVTVYVLGQGFQVTWRLLPISNATRARWKRDQQIAQQCPAYPLCFFFWIGSINGISELLHLISGKPVEFSDLIAPIFCIVLGGICYLTCQRFVRNQPQEPV